MVDNEVGSGAATEESGAVFSGRHDRRKVTDWVYEEVRQAIIELRLQPGAPLREATMAEQLGVSKTPVREALARLEQEGLVETTSFKGAVVSGYSPTDLQEIYELRELLEGAAARSAADAASEETLARLAALVEESRERRAEDDLEGLATLLGAFDLLIYEQVTNERIRALIENLKAHLARIGRLTEEIPGRVEGVRRGARRDRRRDRGPRPRRRGARDARAHPERAGRSVARPRRRGRTPRGRFDSRRWYLM